LTSPPNQIPIFPLGVVLLPEMNMPLHIFEECYKIMINECAVLLQFLKELQNRDLITTQCGVRPLSL